MFEKLRSLRLRIGLLLIGRRNMRWEYLWPSPHQVIAGMEKNEVVFAADQPQYHPLRAIRANTIEGQVLSRWTLSPEQRAAIAGGADIYLELLTFRSPLQPITMAVGHAPSADYFLHHYQLNEGDIPPGPPAPPRNPKDRPVG